MPECFLACVVPSVRGSAPLLRQRRTAALAGVCVCAGSVAFADKHAEQGLQSQGSLMQSTLPRTVSMAYFEKTRRMQGGFTPMHSDMGPMHPAALALRICRWRPEPARPLQLADDGTGNSLPCWVSGWLAPALTGQIPSAQGFQVTEAWTPCRAALPEGCSEPARAAHATC